MFRPSVSCFNWILSQQLHSCTQMFAMHLYQSVGEWTWVATYRPFTSTYWSRPKRGYNGHIRLWRSLQFVRRARLMLNQGLWPSQGEFLWVWERNDVERLVGKVFWWFFRVFDQSSNDSWQATGELAPVRPVLDILHVLADLTLVMNPLEKSSWRKTQDIDRPGWSTTRIRQQAFAALPRFGFGSENSQVAFWGWEDPSNVYFKGLSWDLHRATGFWPTAIATICG